MTGSRAQVLSGKTLLPVAPPDAVRRPDLEARLTAASGSRGPQLVVVRGPAGFGKTTLLASWARSSATRGQPVAWCTFDVGDATCYRAWSVLLAALGAVGPELRERVDTLSAPHAPANGEFLPRVLREIGREPLVIVLENLQDITDPGTLADLDYVARHLPGDCTIVLSSRTEPQLPTVQRAKLEGRLVQLTTADLAFSREEVERACPAASPERLQAIWSVTEGWPALVRLLDLTMRSTGTLDESALVRDGDLTDYLFGEVFRRQTPRVRRVLRAAAVPEALTVDLGVALSGEQGAGAVLERAAAESGLLARVSRSEEVWYRLHPLLRSYLRAELRNHDSGAERVAQETTARWYAAAGFHLDAVRHATASGNADLLDEVVSVAGPRLINGGEAGALLEALGPSSDDRGDTWTRLMRGAALLDLGRVEEATGVLFPIHHLADARPRPREPDDLWVAWEAADVHRRRRGGLPPDMESLLRPVSTRDPDLRLLLSVQRGSALLRQRRWESAKTELDVGLELARGLGRPAAQIDLLTFRAALHAARSELAHTSADAAEALLIADAHGWGNTARMAYAHLNRAWSAWQELDDTAARRHVDRAGDLLETEAEPTIRLAIRGVDLALRITAHAADEPHDPDGSAEAARLLHWAVVDLAAPDIGPITLLNAALIDVRQSLATHRHERIPETAEVIRERVGECGELVLVTALQRQAQGRHHEARQLLGRLVHGPSPMATALSDVEALARLATLAHLDEQHQLATETARRALEAATRLRTLRPLADAGPHFHDVLRRGRGRWAFAEATVDAVLAYAPASTGQGPALTPRELDLLRELPALDNAQELAEALFVSVNTVKTHRRHLYRKLGVSSRREALSRARRLGLI